MPPHGATAKGILSNLQKKNAIIRMFFGHVILGCFLKNCTVSPYSLDFQTSSWQLPEGKYRWIRKSSMKWVLLLIKPSPLEFHHFQISLPNTNWPCLPENSLFSSLRKPEGVRAVTSRSCYYLTAAGSWWGSTPTSTLLVDNSEMIQS